MSYNSKNRRLIVRGETNFDVALDMAEADIEEGGLLTIICDGCDLSYNDMMTIISRCREMKIDNDIDTRTIIRSYAADKNAILFFAFDLRVFSRNAELTIQPYSTNLEGNFTIAELNQEVRKANIANTHYAEILASAVKSNDQKSRFAKQSSWFDVINEMDVNGTYYSPNDLITRKLLVDGELY